MHIRDLQLIRPIPDDESLIRTIVARVSRLMLVYGAIALFGSIAALALTVGGGMAGIFILLVLALLLSAKNVFPVIQSTIHRAFAHWNTGHAVQRDGPATKLPPTDTSSSMTFDYREWVGDIVTGAITGLVSGAASATFVPAPPFLDLMVFGGVTGLVIGLCIQPIKWLLSHRAFAHWNTGHAVQRDGPATELPHTDTSSSMTFDYGEWASDIVTGVITGLVNGAASATFVPALPFLDLMVFGGVAGLVTGLCVQPIRWLLNRRPGAAEGPEILSARLEETASGFMRSAFYMAALATCTLTICLGVIAWATGTSFVECYQYVFARLSGTLGIRIPAFGYVTFQLYTAMAALVAISTHKRIAGAWSHRRHMR